MSRLAVVDRTKLNLQAVTVLLKGSCALEVDMLYQICSAFGARQIVRTETLGEMREALGADLIDLVVIDVTSGLEESLEVVRETRRMTPETRYAPVILTAAHAAPSLVSAAIDAGVSYVVVKPVTPRVLFERLLWIVKDARAFVESESYVGPCRRVRLLGPPAGMAGRRAGDLPPEIGHASTPNLSQADIDDMFPARKAG